PGQRRQCDHQPQSGAYEMGGSHHPDAGTDRERAEREQQHVRGGHASIALRAAVSSLAGSPCGSCAGGGGTVHIHSRSVPFSWSRSRMSYSAYSNSGVQNSASNGQASMQMPQYMHNEKSMAKRSS